jgi:hypothetical protein
VESRTGITPLSVKYAAITFVAVGVTWLLHEFAHWTTGEALGNSMVMTLNACYPKNGQYAEVLAWNSSNPGRTSDNPASSNNFLFTLKNQSKRFLISVFINLLIHAIPCRSDELYKFE